MSDIDLATRRSARRPGENVTDFPGIRDRVGPADPFGAVNDNRMTLRAGSGPTTLLDADHVSLQIFHDLNKIESIWRAFERHADCTVFQTFDWLATWHQHIGTLIGTIPVIVLGRDTDNRDLFILPLAIVTRGVVRSLTWLGSDLCDYNGPLLGKNVSERFGRDGFARTWQRICDQVRAMPGCGFDVVDLPKMPEAIGEQRNPFLGLQTLPNPSGAYVAILGDDWDQFYAAKRSGPTRKKERRQLKQLGELGEVRFVDAQGRDDAGSMLDTLINQKERSFARMGVDSIFARPGYRAFFRAITTDPGTRDLIHVSRLDVGPVVAAANVGLRFRACYYLILSSYDDGDVARFGPGRAHLHELLRYTIDCGYRRFDFTIGDEPYKRDWADIELTLHDHLAAVTLRGGLVVAITAALRRAKRYIKQTPAIWDVFSKARACAGAILRR